MSEDCRHLALIVLLAVGPIVGCTSQTKTVSLPLTPPETFSSSGSDVVPNRWWTTFGDERLNTMVDSALSSNFDLKTAWQRLRAANAVVDRESGERFPNLEAYARWAVRDASEEFEDNQDIELGLASEYEVDLWGRVRSSADAERYRALATLADYQTAALTLSGEIVLTWYRLAEAHDQLALVEKQIETNETVLKLLQNRFGMGQIRAVDILRQRQLVAARREQRGYAESRIAVLQNRLLVLLGRPPQEAVDIVPEGTPGLPPLPETGVPMDLVRRRPDVQRAFNLLRAADRDLASAVSNRYPRLSLSASGATAVDRADDLFQEWASSFVSTLVAPIFRGGELSAEVDRNEAVKQQRLYEYGQTVLLAFREVEDALALEVNQITSVESIEEQVDLAQQAYERLHVEYLNGTSNYLDVLIALDEVQRLRRDHLAAKLLLTEYRVALYRALAGSLQTAREVEE